ncbi:hypothetical protein NQ315_009054, partial [Exocentrus adspersus]
TTLLTFIDLGLRGGEVGLAITQAGALTGIVQWERLLEYKYLPQEKQPDVPKVPRKTWPDKGEITFNHMGLRYVENGSPVLKNLNLVIKPTEKVGIVGRTGAGKSSLISALFRLAIVDGEIKIDELNTKDLILHDLRSKISVIPQDPILFSGTFLTRPESDQ